jgi:hypothetical protein
MFTEYKIQLEHDHLIIDDHQGILIDTGSPTSFHDTGRIELCGDSFSVPKSMLNVTSEYLTTEVGCDIHGILGMDFISKHPILFELRNNFIFVDDDAYYYSHLPSYKLPYNLVCVEMNVNGKPVRLIVDTGAKISYIEASIVEDLDSVDTKQDFSPIFGHFGTTIYECNVQFLENRSNTLKFGVPPLLLSKFMATMNVQGILGLDFFRLYRLQLRNSVLYFPPQGI